MTFINKIEIVLDWNVFFLTGILYWVIFYFKPMSMALFGDSNITVRNKGEIYTGVKLSTRIYYHFKIPVVHDYHAKYNSNTV